MARPRAAAPGAETPTRTTRMRPSTVAARAAAKLAAGQPALIQRPDPERPSEHNGREIVREVPIEHLPGKPFRISRIFFADDTFAFACRDCLLTGDTRGVIMAHRNEVHGSRIGMKQPKVVLPRRTEAPDPVLEPRANGQTPQTPMDMTLREILAIAPSLKELGDLVERMEAERDGALRELALRTRHDRENQHKIDVYDSHRAEIVDLRLALQKQGNYEHVKDEMYALRAWKKKMIQKLSALGFQLNEEDQ